MFCFSSELSWIMVLHATILVSLESSWWVRVQQLGLRLFGAMMWKLLIIEPFCEWKLNKIKTESSIDIWGVLDVKESHRQVGFNRVYFTIFRAKVWKILTFEWILLLKNSNKSQKLGFRRKNQLSSQCVHTWANNIGYTNVIEELTCNTLSWYLNNSNNVNLHPYYEEK